VGYLKLVRKRWVLVTHDTGVAGFPLKIRSYDCGKADAKIFSGELKT
jgi:hypothetical protein